MPVSVYGHAYNDKGVSMLTIASVQLTSQNNLADNLRTIERAIRTAKAADADFVVLPENACYMGRQADIAPMFERLSDELARLAQRYSVHLLAGTLPCPHRPTGEMTNGRLRQSSLLFDDNGALLQRYDKLHLFRAEVGDSVGSYDEGRTFEAGEMPVVAECVIHGTSVRVGMMVCFDLRFANLAHKLRAMGADILVAPSAFTFATGKANWAMLLSARALDAQCLVVGAAQGGEHTTGNSTRATWGHSAIVAADGAVLATTGRSACGEQGYLLALAPFNKAPQQQIRERLPVFDCMRTF